MENTKLETQEVEANDEDLVIEETRFVPALVQDC